MPENADFGCYAVFWREQLKVFLEVADSVGVVGVGLEVCDGVSEEVPAYGVVFVGRAFLAAAGFLSLHVSVLKIIVQS